MLQLWTNWIEFLSFALDMAASELSLGTGAAIIVLTLALRIALLPLSWSSAWSNCLHQRRIADLRPQLDELRTRYADNPAKLAEATLKLHRDRGIAMINARPLIASLLQAPVVLGMFQMLRSGLSGARFLWVESLARPDFWFALIAAATTAMVMAANPEMPEQTRQLLIWLPGILTFVFALKFACGLALFWATSNCFAAAQTWAVHRLVAQRVGSGKLRI